MAGKYRNRVKKRDDLEYAKEMSLMESLKDKYGFSD